MLGQRGPSYPSGRSGSDQSPALLGAFTLVELLVVIAVIAILAALLLPVLNRAQERGRTAVCRSNLHQYGLALQMYVEDFKAYPTYGRQVINGDLSDWEGQLHAYTKAVFMVPVPPALRRPAYGFLCPTYVQLGGLLYPPMYASYAYNGMGYGEAFTAGGNLTGLGGDIMATADTNQVWRPVREAEVVKPSDTFAIADSPIEHNFQPGYFPAYTYKFMGSMELGSGGNSLAVWFGPDLESQNRAGLADPRMWIRNRHGNRWNVVFCDGHQENLRSVQLWDYRSDAVMRRWSRDHQAHFSPN